MNLKINDYCYWGKIDNIETLADGIVQVCTPSHGGIILDEEHAKKINHIRSFTGLSTCWEEDCDWAVPFIFFVGEIIDYAEKQGRDLIDMENLQQRIDAAKRMLIDFNKEVAFQFGLLPSPVSPPAMTLPEKTDKQRAEELKEALQNLVNTLEQIEDLEHDQFGCRPHNGCPLCDARRVLADL